MPVINAVGVMSSDMKRTVAFYSALGFDFSGADLTQDHVEPKTGPGETRLMIDTVELMQQLIGAVPEPGTLSAFALLCEDAAEVDRLTAGIAAKGFTVVKEPWDAFWGQRYAVVRDPDGYMVDLFAPL